MENLIHVPIESPSYKGILKAVSSDNQGTQATQGINSLKQVRKKWKRNKGKENVNPVQGGLLSSEEVTLEKKRTWQLRDEEDHENLVVQHKKLRGVIDCEMDDVVVVG